MIKAPQLRPSARGLSAAVPAALWSLGLLAALPLESALPVLPVGLLLSAMAFEPRPPALREGLGLTAPLWLFVALHYQAVGSWWLGDDPCNLGQSLEHGLWRPFVEPVGAFLTPSLLLSLGLDLRWFGLDPAAFYLHQLAAFAVLIAVAYGYLRSHLPAQAAAFAVTLLVGSAPAWAVARQLMNRHYLEGLIAALASLWLYRRSIATGRTSMAVLGAATYLLAMSAKEVFVPVVLLLPFLGDGSSRGQWRRILPYTAALAFYTAWRFFVLGVGNSLAAYGALSGESGGRELLTRIPAILGWSHPASSTLLWLLVLGGAIAVARAGRAAFLATLMLGIALAAPLLPVIGRLEPRHLFLAALAAAAAIAFALWRATDGMSTYSGPARTATGLLLLLLGLFGMARSPVATHLTASVESHRREGQALLAGGLDGSLVTEINHSHFLECLTRLKRELLGRDDGPGFCGDLCYCSEAHRSEPLLQVSPDGTLTELKPPPASCSVAAPVEIDMRHDLSRRRLSWELGPYLEGSYAALIISGSEHPGVSVPVPVPRQGSLVVSAPLCFVIRYDSPDGWQAYSAVHQVVPGGRAVRRDRCLPS